MSIKLPKPGEIILPKSINPRLLLLYGSPKIGKTDIISLMNGIENYLLIDIDDGVDYFTGTYIQATNLDELNEIFQQIIEDGKLYKYIIIDTISKLAEWMEEYATMMYKSSNLGRSFKGDNVLELPKGAGYYWLRRAFMIWFKEIKNLAPRVIFLGHLKDAALTTRTPDEMGNLITVEKLGVDEVSSLDLDLVGKLKQITCANVDAIGYIYRKTIAVKDEETKKLIPKSEIRVNFNAGSSVLGGARPKHLRGLDTSFDWKKIYIEED